MPAKETTPSHKETHKTAFPAIARSSSSITSGIEGREYTGLVAWCILLALIPVSADV